MSRFRFSGRSIPAAVSIVLALSCADPTSTDDSLPLRHAKKSGGGSTGSPTVTSTSPSSSTRGVTLDVRIFGSGFDAGSQAQWAIDSVPSSKVSVNSTRYVSTGEVVANITVAEDADLALYDVIVVTGSGKPGIGTETFEVTLDEADLPTLGGAKGAGIAINDQGVIVGMTTDRTADRNGTSYPVRWNLVSGKWVVTKLAAAASVNAIAHGINESNIIVGMSSYRAMAWLPNGTAVDLGPGCAIGINNAGVIVGARLTANGFQGTAWIPNAGAWVPQDVPHSLDPNTGPMYCPEFAPLRAINGAGTIVGYPYGQQTAAKWTALSPSGPWSNPTLLSTYANGTGMNGDAVAINEAGDILGTLNRGNGDIASHLWRAAGGEIHYSDLGSGSGFGRGLNDRVQPDVVVTGGGGRCPMAIFSGATHVTRLNRFCGANQYDGPGDINNGSATQPMRIVGAVTGKPKVWTFR